MKQNAKAIPPPDTQINPPAVAAVVMPVRFPKSSAVLKTANIMMTVCVKQRQLKFHPVQQAIAAKQSVILSE